MHPLVLEPGVDVEKVEAPLEGDGDLDLVGERVPSWEAVIRIYAHADGELAPCLLADPRDYLADELDPVLDGASVRVSSAVGGLGIELLQEHPVRSMQVDAVEAALHGVGGGDGVRFDHAPYLLMVELRGVTLLMPPGTEDGLLVALLFPPAAESSRKALAPCRWIGAQSFE